MDAHYTQKFAHVVRVLDGAAVGQGVGGATIDNPGEHKELEASC